MFRAYVNRTEPIRTASRPSPDRRSPVKDVTCPACGRHEAAGAYCTGCGHRYQS